MRTNFYKSKKQNHLSKTLKQMSKPHMTLHIPHSDGQMKEVQFQEMQFKGKSEIETSTFVQEQVNRRQQSLLKASNLTDLTATIGKAGQMFPAVGVLQSDGRIEILDGSRRRQAVILADGIYKVWVTRTALSHKEAIYIAKTANQQKKISEFELGLYFKSLIEADVCADQIAVAAQEGISTSKVSRCISASEISSHLLNLFPDYNQLSVRDIQRLLKVDKLRRKQSITLEGLVALCDGCDLNLNDSHAAKEVVLQQLEKSILSTAKKLSSAPKNKQRIYQESKDKYIEVREDDNKSVITLSRIEKSKREQIIKAIEAITCSF